MDNNELKAKALKERIGQITSDYEDTIADLRVYITDLLEKNRHLEMALEASSEKAIPAVEEVDAE